MDRFAENGVKMPTEWPALKATWLEALHSGEYQQGKGQLCKDDKFCCLGVFVDACIDTDWVSFNVGSDYPGDEEFVWGVPEKGHGYVEYSLLPNDIAEKYLLENVMDDLAIMNDGRGASSGLPVRRKKNFNQIADWIEKNL